MNNDHQSKDELCLYDVLLLFMLRSPDIGKAIAGLEILFGPVLMKWLIDYKHRFKSYQDWRIHLIASLDAAQEKVDATGSKPIIPGK